MAARRDRDRRLGDRMKSATSVPGTSRHFAALRNLVAVEGIADIDQTAPDQAFGSNLGQFKAITAVAPKQKIAEQSQADLGRPVRFAKIYRFAICPNHL